VSLCCRCVDSFVVVRSCWFVLFVVVGSFVGLAGLFWRSVAAHRFLHDDVRRGPSLVVGRWSFILPPSFVLRHSSFCRLSLFVHCSLFIVHCSLFIVRPSSFVVVLSAVCRCLFTVHRCSCTVRRPQFVVVPSSFAVHKLLLFLRRSWLHVCSLCVDVRPAFLVVGSLFVRRSPFVVRRGSLVARGCSFSVRGRSSIAPR